MIRAGLTGIPVKMVSEKLGVDPRTVMAHYERYTVEEVKEHFKRIQE